jgi:AI-2 transport protein TqsA
MTQIHNDVAHYTGIFAKTGVLMALANLVLLAVFGVDFPLVRCALYYFLPFIPRIGFILALVPASCVALLMLSWKKALLVAGGLVLTELVSEHAITPMLLRNFRRVQ